MNEFTPKRIGKQDIELEQKIVRFYYDLCNQANEIAFTLDSYLGYLNKAHLDPSVFFEFMNCKDSRAFLYLQYIEKHGMSFPGISISKVIELGLADVPLEAFADLLDSRIKLLKNIQSTEQLKFHYPLIKLWNLTSEMFFVIDIDGDNVYTIESADFESKLTRHTGNFTVTESDNEVLEAIEKTIDSLNDLVRLGIIRNTKARWQNDIERFINAIVFNNYQERPLSVNPRLTRLSDFRRFFTKSDFIPVMGKPTDILKFEAPASAKSEESQKDLLQSEDPDLEQTEAIPEEIFKTE